MHHVQQFPFPACREKGTPEWIPKVNDSKGHSDWTIWGPKNLSLKDKFLLYQQPTCRYATFPFLAWLNSPTTIACNEIWKQHMRALFKSARSDPVSLQLEMMPETVFYSKTLPFTAVKVIATSLHALQCIKDQRILSGLQEFVSHICSIQIPCSS